MKLQETPTAPAAASHTMRLGDGTHIFYRAWVPERPVRRALVLFHRGHEHSGRLADVVEALGLSDTAVFAWDARGHGRSDGERGHAPGFARLVRDVDEFMRHLCAAHGLAMEDISVLAHSVGAVAVTSWVHDYAPRIRSLVLVTPAFKVRLYVPFAIPGLRVVRRFKRGKPAFVTSYVKARMLTHDEEQARLYDADEHITRSISVDVLLDMHDTARRIVADAGAIRVPTLLLSGGSDWVVSTRVQRQFFEKLGSAEKRMRLFDGMYHDLLHEKERELVFEEVRAFLARDFEPRTPLLDADRVGYTFAEYERLLAPPSLRGIGYRAQRLAMRTGGRLSRGIRLGLKTGFDSGRTLDYVYENRARGALGIGALIDRAYLSSVGWRGIRQRKVNLERMLARAMRAVAGEDRDVRLLDIATGAGRYVLDALAAMPEINASAVLRDHTPANLEAGRALAQRMGLENVRFEQGDAFDPASVAAESANIGIVSGLYELFPDNTAVLASLRGMAQALQGGDGYLIYTGQPWHPQLEMISRVLPNREGERWTMRRRTQEEMDDLVRAAGFEKLDMLIDDDGIFTVSLARLRSE